MLTRQQKSKIIEEFSKKTKKAKAVLLVDFSGLKVFETQNLRRLLKKDSIELKIIKKTLIQRILEAAGIKKFSVFQFPASVALVFSPEEGIVVSKNIYEFSKKAKTFKILGGSIDKNFVDADFIVQLAKLPSREVLLSQLVYVLSSLPRALVGVLQGNLQKLVIALDAIAKTKQ